MYAPSEPEQDPLGEKKKKADQDYKARCWKSVLLLPVLRTESLSSFSFKKKKRQIRQVNIFPAEAGKKTLPACRRRGNM